MIKKNWIVCDATGVILNDGVTIYPGYVEVLDGWQYTYTTDDPMNDLADVKPWILHNRIQYKRVEKKRNRKKLLQNKHFVSEKVMTRYLTKMM